MVLSLKMERKSGFPFTMSATEKDPKTGLPQEVDVKGLVNDPGGANEETPSSESLPNMGSSENMTRQAEQTLKSTGTPMTPDKLFLAM